MNTGQPAWDGLVSIRQVNPPNWVAFIRGLFGDCIDHEHEQVGRCVYCKQCGRRLYSGIVIPANEMAELKEAMANV